MITRKKTLIAVSALALKAAIPSPAFAQVVISCPQSLSFGRLASCANGRLSIQPNGATSTVGCAVITQTAQPAVCHLSAGITPPDKDVVVDMSATLIDMNGQNNGAARVDTFRMQSTATADPAQASLTFSPTEVINGVTIHVGATLNFTRTQPIGTYLGQITINAN